MSFMANLMKAVLRKAGIPVLTDDELRALVEEKRERSEKKAEASAKANDVVGDYLHTLNADSMEAWIEQNKKDDP
jgi:hypothetical protein